ncbi:hypothetical protein ABZW10_38340 [Kitasatospora sp. NPDC004723]|uniref:hypothetical protein n=1 Tax=Kitasatospora sp. NPDC004723 TaxID=3154288 RepID=UPI0033B199A0
MSAGGSVEQAQRAAVALAVALGRIDCVVPTIDAYPEPVGPAGEPMVRFGLVPAATVEKLARFIDEHVP